MRRVLIIGLACTLPWALACTGSGASSEPTSSVVEPEPVGQTAKVAAAPESEGYSAAGKGLFLGRDGVVWKSGSGGWFPQDAVDIGRGYRDATRVNQAGDSVLVLHKGGLNVDGDEHLLPDWVQSPTDRHVVGDTLLVLPSGQDCEADGTWFDIGAKEWKRLPAAPLESHTGTALWEERLYLMSGEPCNRLAIDEPGEVYSIPWPPSSDVEWRREVDSHVALGWRRAVAMEGGIVIAGVMKEGQSTPASFWTPSGDTVSEATPEAVKTAIHPFLLPVGDEVLVATEMGLFGWKPQADTWRQVSDWKCSGPLLVRAGDSIWAAGWSCPAEQVVEGVL